MRIRHVFVCFCLIVYWGCSGSEDYYEPEEMVEEEVIEPRNDSLFNCALDNMREKAALMSTVRWRPVSSFSSHTCNYEPGREYRGIPYSSAKEKDKFIGLDVSFYTFLSAVNNPNSVLYTERIDSLPYHGINCSTYYGTTCSSSVCYALGLGNQIPSADFKNSPLFYKLEGPSVIDSLEAGDVLASSGHSILVLDTRKDSRSRMTEVELFEIFDVFKMTATELVGYVGTLGETFSVYRYKYLQRNQEKESLPFDHLSARASTDFFANTSLCPSLGDRSVYSEGDVIVLNILQSGYERMELYRDGIYVKTYPLSGSADLVLTGLDKGLYTAKLVKDDQDCSEDAHFEVIDTDVRRIKLGTNQVKVSYNSTQGEPHSIVLCNINGKQILVHFLTKNEKKAGYVDLKYVNNDNEQLYCKVLFSGQYGRVSNNPIAL